MPYHFVFNGPTREQEPLAQEPPNQVERTIPWVLVGPRSDRNRDLLGALFEHEIDPGGFCLLNGRPKNLAPPEPMLVAQSYRQSCRKPDIICGVLSVTSCIMRVFVLSSR